ncbi:MAG: response regulator [Anaerolineae bacterium]|jgi:two-component system cell cycle response regulator DivK
MAGETILIVEDSEFNQRLLEAVLIPRGYRLLIAKDGESGVALAQAKRPDLILMDILLPGIDGYEATRQLRADTRTRHIVIVALTASAESGEQDQALAAGCDGYIAKPIDTRAFPQQIRQILSDARRA